MGEPLEEARAQSRNWHFEQTRKYTNALDVAYEHIRLLEKKDKEEKNIKEVANEEAIQEEEKQVFLSEKDGDEIMPIGKLIRKHEIIDPIDKNKAK